MLKESKGIRDIHSLYESIYNTESNIENQLVSLQETAGFNDLTEDDLIELTDLIESVEFASLTEEEKRNIIQKVQDKLAGSKRAGFLGQLERTRRKVFGTKKEKEDTKKFDDENENVPGVGIKKKDEKDDDKEEIKGPNINNNKSNKKDSDKKDSDEVGGSTTSGTKEQQSQNQQKVIDQFKKEQEAKKQKESSDDEKGANEWGSGGQPSASKQIDAYKKGRPSPASFKTNQRQTRELIKKQSKEVYPSVTKKDLNQFNRTKKYSADDGSQVERSTVFTKHYKTGKPLGVMTGSQRKAYDKAAAAYKAQPTPTPKAVETKPVETKPDTYKTNIGAFLNNKKKGDVKDKSRHTKVASVLDIEDSYDAYDLVLDYIMESKQASSIEEANYIMMEMDQNTIHEIVVEQKKTLGEGLAKLVGLGAAGYGLWKAGKWAKKKGDKALDGARKNMKIGGENRKKEIENKSGVDLDNW